MSKEFLEWSHHNRPSIDTMIDALVIAGWKPWRKHRTIWEDPSGRLFRGPALAYWVMLQHKPIKKLLSK